MLKINIQNHRPLREIVYEELKNLIISGELPPGTRLMEENLAEEMGVSRTPIRESIRKLEKEGLITIEPRRGAYVSQMSKDDIIEILEVRQNMEGLAAALAATRMSRETRDELVKVAEEYERAVAAGKMNEMVKWDSKFHHMIVEATGNKILVQMVERLQELVLRFRYLYYDHFRRAEQMVSEHAAIFRAIIQGDEEGAKHAADVHIDKLKVMVQQEGLDEKRVSRTI